MGNQEREFLQKKVLLLEDHKICDRDLREEEERVSPLYPTVDIDDFTGNSGIRKEKREALFNYFIHLQELTSRTLFFHFLNNLFGDSLMNVVSFKKIRMNNIGQHIFTIKLSMKRLSQPT